MDGLSMTASESAMLNGLTAEADGGQFVQVGESAAVHGRGVIAVRDASKGQAVAFQRWPLACSQEVTNSWRAGCCDVCMRFTGTLGSQLRTLASATGDAETWAVVASAFPSLAPVIARELAEQGLADGSAGPDEDGDPPVAEVCLLDDGLGPAIPAGVIGEEDQELEAEVDEVGGVEACSAGCVAEAGRSCLPLLRPEGQAWFAQRLTAKAEEWAGDGAARAAVAGALREEALLLASPGPGDGSEGADGPEDPLVCSLSGALEEHARQHSDSLGLAARVYAGLLGRFLDAARGETLASVLRGITVMSTAPWEEIVGGAAGAEAGEAAADDAAAAAGSDEDEDDALDPARLARATSESLAMLRAVLEPRFRAVARMRWACGLESPAAPEAAADDGGASAASDDDVTSWGARARARGWGVVAEQLEAAERLVAPPVPGKGRDGGGAAAASASSASTSADWPEMRCPSGSAVASLFSPAAFSRVVGLFDVNCVGVSIASPVARALASIASSAARDDAASLPGPAGAAAAAAAGGGGEDGEDGAEAEAAARAAAACWPRLRDALVAASMARRMEGSDEADPVAESVVAGHRGVSKAVGAVMHELDIDAGTATLVGCLCPPASGSALYPLVAMTNHGDDPNAEFTYLSGCVSVSLVALRPVAAGEEVTISYCDEALSGEARSLALRHYGIPTK